MKNKKSAKKKLKKVAKRVVIHIKPPVKERPTLVNIKVMKNDLKILNSQARKYADGNLSLWLRFAGIHYVPKRKDLSP